MVIYIKTYYNKFIYYILILKEKKNSISNII